MQKKQSLIIPLLLIVVSTFIYAGLDNRAEAFTVKSSGQQLNPSDWSGLDDDFLPTATATKLRIVNGLKLRLDGGTNSGELQLRTYNNGAGNHWAIYSHEDDGNLNFWYGNGNTNQGNNFFTINKINGNTNIGTSSLSDKLVVSTNSANGGITIDGSSPALKLSNGTTRLSLGLAATGDTIISNNSNILFSTDSGLNTILALKSSNGNVGIGMTTPNAKLDVLGDINASGTICNNSGCVSTTGNDWAKGSGTNIHNSNSGNVGIGINTPSQKLEVNGNVRATSFCAGSNACTNKLSYQVIGGGNISGSTSNFDISQPWSLISFVGSHYSGDAGAAGGFVYKLNGIIHATIFEEGNHLDDFSVGNSDTCVGSGNDMFCIQKNNAGTIRINTGAHIQLKYSIID